MKLVRVADIGVLAWYTKDMIIKQRKLIGGEFCLFLDKVESDYAKYCPVIDKYGELGWAFWNFFEPL